MQKVGTFLCWLFGHKFTGQHKWLDEKEGWCFKVVQMPFCERCGADKEKQ